MNLVRICASFAQHWGWAPNTVLHLSVRKREMFLEELGEIMDRQRQQTRKARSKH